MTWLLSILGLGGIGAALFLIPGALPAVINGFSALLALIRRNPWQCAVIALCGLSLWLWHGKSRANDQRDAWHKAWTLQKRASDLAAEAQKALNTKIQQTYKDQADAGEKRHSALVADTGALTDDYIAARRVRAKGCEAGGGDPAAATGDPSVPSPVSAQAVLVEESDVRTCGDLYAYALGAHEFTENLIKAGVAR